ncbi:MAG: ABC transporter substrate binding protein [Pseudomonadota bacterium]
MRKHSVLEQLAAASIAILTVLIATVSSATADTGLKRVLVLHSYHKGLGWTDSIAQGIEKTFRTSGQPIEIFTEYMDTKRIFDEKYLGDLTALFKYKYRNRRFDAIISSDDHAFQFLLSHHDTIFPGAPVVFCGVNYFKDEMIADTADFTGVVESFSIKGTIDAALTINPNLRSVYSVVDKTVTGKANLKLLEQIIPLYGDRLTFITITDKDMAEVQQEVSHLPHESIVLLLAFTSDHSGNTFSLEQSADLITAASNCPVYSFWDFHLDHGVVGGMLTTGFSQGVAAAELALRVLSGERPAAIPVIKDGGPNRYIFDDSVLKRFDLPASRLPAGSTVINRPPSFYDQYRRLVWQVALAFGMLLLFTVVIALNLLERRAVETKLKKSEDKFRTLVETSSDWIWEVDARGRYTYVSPKIKELLGYAPEEVIGKTPFDFMAPAEAERIGALFAEVSRQRLPIEQLINTNLSKNGREVILETTGAPILSADGTLLGYRGIDRDITDRQQAAQELRESEARFRDLAELLPETVYEVDLQGRLRFTNKSGFDQFLYTPEDLEIGFNIATLIDPADHGKMMDNITRILQGEDLGLNEYTAIRKDGSRFPVMARSSLILKDGEPVGMRGFLIDISERKRLEERFHLAQRMESIGTLAGGIAHNFNNLLMGIQGRASLIQIDLEPDAPQMEHAKGIEEYVKSASQLTKQLLGFARSGKYDLKATDLNTLLEKTIDMFGRTRKELRISKKFADNLYTAVVDRSQIEQVLLNLFVNAWQAMPDGGDLTVSTRNLSLSVEAAQAHGVGPGDYGVIEVSDTGIGMDDKTRERIFEPFFSTKSRDRGTGLGLASAYGIVKHHNGAITVASKPGDGTTFTVLLPASRKTPVAIPHITETITRGSETILLVDDEEMILSVGEALLTRLGYHVITAGGGKKAVSVFTERTSDIDLVVLDLIMPDLSGRETFAQLKAVSPSVRVLLSSGYSIEGEASEILKNGCSGFIQKPFDLQQLSLKIRGILDNDCEMPEATDSRET